MDTRQAILQAAARVFAQHGFRGSTTRRIAQSASVNEVTIFRYFGSKAALLQEAVKGVEVRSLDKPLPRDPVDPVAELTAWCSTFMSHLRLRGSVMRKCMGELEERPELAARAVEVPGRATRELTAYFRRLRVKGLAAQDLDAPVAATMLIGALFHDAMGRDIMPGMYPVPASTITRRYVLSTLRSIGFAEKKASRPAAASHRERTSQRVKKQ